MHTNTQNAICGTPTLQRRVRSRCAPNSLCGSRPTREAAAHARMGRALACPPPLPPPPPARWRWLPRRRRRRRLSPGQTGAAPAASRATGPPPPRRGRGLPAPGSGGRGAEPSGRRSPGQQCVAAASCDLSAAAGQGPLNGGLLRQLRLWLLRAWRGVAAARCCLSSYRDRPIPACPTGMGSTSVSWASWSPSSPPSNSER